MPQTEQVKSIEQIKLSSKKRSGVAQFIKYFPVGLKTLSCQSWLISRSKVYVSRLESQLTGAHVYEVRETVDNAYERLVQTMLESLKQIAKLEGEGEDKGQLNYHVILIGTCTRNRVRKCQLINMAENMYYFVHELERQQLGSVRAFLRRAETIYDENLLAYVKLVLRRPMVKILVRRTCLAYTVSQL